MKLSVIIVNYNVKYFLEQCLLSVQKAITGIEADIWVVDNASSDGSVEMLRSQFPGVRLIANADNVGFSRANNQALRASEADYVLLLNPDTVVAEDTFSKCLAFMEARPQAGGLGIRMLDGGGRFLKESKRGLPTPRVAFYKMFGISALFKNSPKYGQYHLTYLSEQENHPVDILAGAFMLMRKSLLNQIGLLDEKYFMYGEDIDLSYRIRLAGAENWYFAESAIIHYKGESTKKDSVNYVRVFYQAMAIFAKQYFSARNARLFAWLIQFGIFFRAGIALLRRWSKLAFHPLLDAGLIYGGMYLLTQFWENNVKVDEGLIYPPIYMQLIVPIYVLLWVLSAYFSGAYDKPFRAAKLVRGLLVGTIVISAAYGFFPADHRYSRGLIVVGAAWSILLTVSARALMNLALYGRTGLTAPPEKGTLVVGSALETDRVHAILQRAGVNHKFLGFVSDLPGDEDNEFYVGRLADLPEAVRALRVDELIFCGRDLSNKQIIGYFESLGGLVEELKIVPEGSDYVIGSSSVDYPGDTYTPDFNLRISLPASKRNKRVVDLAAGMLLLLGLPLFFWLYPAALRRPLALFQLLFGQRTLVGYPPHAQLPKLKPALIDLAAAQMQPALQLRIRKSYVKDYTALEDVKILLRSFFPKH
ncbi:MAG: glycosyltransferase [Sphingobacteriaceae bacterium]|nr:glycosyltransferase [Sphingobacteriaceae bacterium]